jgi:metallothiol transferase
MPRTLAEMALSVSLERSLQMNVKGINHLTYSVSNLKQAISFYRDVLGAELLVEGNNLAYFSLNGLWLALNVENDIYRNPDYTSYTHIAFTIDEADFDTWIEKLDHHKVNILSGRERDIRDKRSVYFTDPDGHKFELHTGKLGDRIKFYKEDKPYMSFYTEG